MRVKPAMMKTTVALLIVSLALMAASARAESNDTSSRWVLGYQGKSTNEFSWDKRTAGLVNTRVPPALSDDVLTALGGPPDPVVVVDGRYVSMSACRPHSCTEKGFLWVDTKTGVGLGAYYVSDTLRLGSNGMSADHIPVQARQALVAWLTDHDLQTASAELIGRSAERVTLDATHFSAKEKFRAPPTGPAFDCRLAANDIEKTICSDAALSAQDMALNELYNTVRLGNSTTVARDQLRTLQRDWLKNRDRVCAAAGSVAACLKDQYAAQSDRLNNWVPTMPHRP
jgi:uncharacterized protein YecT (DUF1311 family)